MKKLLYILLLITGFVNAQIVNIPDANFEGRLLAASVNIAIAKDINGNNIRIDDNNDGAIEQIEAELVYSLDVGYSLISDLTGIEYFINLQNLNCSNNLLTSLNVSNLLNLISLDCGNNNLINLSVNNNINMESLKCNSNSLSNLIISSSLNLTYLNCSSNNLSNLDLTNNLNLDYLNCGYNNITSLNLSNNLNLNNLGCQGNNLNAINVSSNINLVNLDCSDNNLSTINLFYNINLSQLYCNSNQITSLNLSNNSNLSILWCENNSLNSLNVSNNPNLTMLRCRYNNLSSLNLNNNHVLNYLEVQNNNLSTLIIKNGINEGVSFDNNPNLTYICVDDSEISAIQNQVNSVGLNATVCNSYCSFTPGGNYNIITGQVLFDNNNNGCDATDLPQSNIRLDMTQWGVNSATFTNSNGNYNFYTTFADQMITPNIENSSYYTITPPDAVISFPQTNFLTATQNFCISANGVHPDLEIVIAPITPARPGFDAIYQIVYKNKGNQTLSQLYGVNLFFNQNLMDFVSATTAPATIGSGSLSWSYANLLPFESRSIYVTLNINTPTDVNYPVNIGDVLQFTTSILPIAGDETTTDNTFLYNQTVVGSYDPNDITCIEGTSVSPSLIGEYLHYVINFENTGTAAAENVVVKATVDITKFNLNSLQLLNTSHPSYVKITGNIVEFIFENIALDTGGHGNILLKIRSNETLQSGDNVSNRGDIFFDYNAPIDTGIANTVFQSLNNSTFEKDNSVVIFPNPTQSIINIKSENSIKSIQLYDVQGRLLQTKLTDETSSSIDISDKSNGIYFLKITSDKGIKVERIVKE